MKFEAYKRPDVRDAVNQMCHRKCAYCESDMRGQQPGDIEHYRPKAKVAFLDVDGTRTEVAGYFWLAADWHNLVLACADCNRPRTQDVVDAKQQVVGKANWFPIANETLRAHFPHEVPNEPRLLIDPCVDEPSRHLVFNLDGTIDAKPQAGGGSCPMGKATIEVCGLHRVELMQARVSRLKLVRSTLRHVSRSLALGQEPDPEDLVDLEQFLQPDAEFSAFCRVLVWDQLGPIEPAITGRLLGMAPPAAKPT